HLALLEKYISSERLAAYVAYARGDKWVAVRLYERNTEFSEALYGVIQALEVTLRNAIHNLLSEQLGGAEWYETFNLAESERKALEEAKKKVFDRPAALTPGRVIAELTFAFWGRLFSESYDKTLWVPHLRKIFPQNLQNNRHLIRGRLLQLKTLRNRIAHHERLMCGRQHLRQDYTNILETIGWISPTMRHWVESVNCCEERFARPLPKKPKPVPAESAQTSKPRLPALIFDLDGTLTDSMPGIVGCLRKVIDAWGINYSGPLEYFVGPPVEEWTGALLPDGSEESRAALARDYRGCYDREGWKNNSVFPGVREMLTELHGQGFPLYVCTSKQQHFAVRILDMFELTGLFTAIYGDKAEFTSHSKVDLLASLLRAHSLIPESTWMIGDRIFDIEAAHANGLRCLAVGWGYGPAEECAQADAVAATPADVADLVFPQRTGTGIRETSVLQP
ncbi:MAG: HAD hydrolase-like protein, partial [Terracidiphilus sp.]